MADRKLNPILLYWATAFLKKNDLADLLKIFPPDFLHRKTYSLEYWARLLSLGQFVCPAVCQSAIGPSVRQSVS